MGLEPFAKKFTTDEELKPALSGLFPMDSVSSATFAANFYISIGLGMITGRLRDFIQDAPKILMEQKY